MPNDSATPGQAPVDAEEPKKRKRQKSEAHDSDLEWFIVCGDAAMGARGTLGGTIAVLEHGRQFTGIPNTELYSDQHVGWHKTVVGLVEKHRWLSAAWFLLKPQTQADLLACYNAPPAAFRSDEGFGAKDSCPRVEDIERNRAIETSKPTAFHNRRGTEAGLGRFGALALRTCKDPAALLIACLDPKRGKAPKVIKQAFESARVRAVEAHAEWDEAKAKAQQPRADRERVATTEYEPEEATP